MLPFCVSKTDTICLENQFAQLIFKQQKLIQEFQIININKIEDCKLDVLSSKICDLANQFLKNDYFVINIWINQVIVDKIYFFEIISKKFR